MKVSIFVTWLYFQILLVRCDIFVNNLNGSDAPIKMCIQKTINHLFSENDTLNLILNSDLCEGAIFEMNTTRPYIVLNMEAINDVNKLQYDGQFIICPKDIRSLSHTIHNVYDIAKNNKRNLGNCKILVITNTNYISLVFDMFWHYDINNVIILVYGQGTSKLFTCNRFAPENKCAKIAKLMIRQDCEEQLPLSFTSVIHQMNKCPITFLFYANTTFVNRNYPITRAMHHILVELTNHLNATFLLKIINNWREYYYYLAITRGIVPISVETDVGLGSFDVTEPLIRTDNLWLVPKAPQISNMNVCLKVFKRDVWIATIIVFICTWLMWCLIISRNGGFTFDKLCISFLNVWSLTICGNVAQLPRPTSLALRILLLFYLIYAINMQFAFTSDMSTVLTAPQYDFQIRNLEELVDSQLPVYSLGDFKELYFEKNYTDQILYTKLQNLIHGVTIEQYFDYLANLHLHGNYAVTTRLEDIRTVEIKMNKTIDAYKITDSTMTPVFNVRLSLFIDNYFTTTLNTFFDRMIETGIYEKRKNDFYREFYGENVDKTPEDDLITLKHLSFIFIFFGFGLFTACVVFCFELVLHKYL